MNKKPVSSLLLFLLWIMSFPLLWDSGLSGKVICVGLLLGIIHYTIKTPRQYKEPYIIGSSDKVEYLTPNELEKRLRKRK